MALAWLEEEYGPEISSKWCGHSHSDPYQGANSPGGRSCCTAKREGVSGAKVRADLVMAHIVP